MPIRIDHLIRTRRKTVALVIENNGDLTVRAPLYLSKERIRVFVESHQDWIAKHQAKASTGVQIEPKHYLEGETFLYLGQLFPLAIIPRQRTSLSFDGTTFKLAKSALPKANETFAQWYKQQARLILCERINTLANKHGFQYQKLRLSSARTRWGSCSITGTISITYRLIMAPLEVVDYVVLHELVHTKIKNHSRAFWQELAKFMPDYKDRLAWLKKNGKFLI